MFIKKITFLLLKRISRWCGWAQCCHFHKFYLFQDCGSKIRPEESCGLQPLSREYLSAISQTVFKTCEAGDTKGLYFIPLFFLKINSSTFQRKTRNNINSSLWTCTNLCTINWTNYSKFIAAKWCTSPGNEEWQMANSLLKH